MWSRDHNTQYLIEENIMSVPKRKTTAQKKAIELEYQIFSNSRSNQKPIYEFNKKKCFMDLGHNTLKDWANANREALGRSYDSINNDCHAARITADMCGEEHIGKYAPHALLLMKNISPEEREELFEHAQEHFGEEELDDSHLTHANVKKFMVELEFIDDESEGGGDDESGGDDGNTTKQLTEDEQDFNDAISEAKSKHFAKRIAIAINEVIEPIKVLRICKFVLKSYKNDHVIEEIDGMIKKLKG